MHNDLEDALARVARAPGNSYHQCLAFAVSWVTKQKRTTAFTSGTLRQEAAKAGIVPAESRVWGAVLRTLRKEQLIIACGTTQEGRSHSGLATLWTPL